MEPQPLAGNLSRSGFGLPIWAASFSLNVLALLMPLSILMIFDRIIPFQSTDTLRVLTVVLIISAAAELVLRQCRTIMLTSTAEGAAIRNRRRFLKQVLNANTRSFSQNPDSTYFERFAAIDQLRDYQSGQSQTLSIDLPFTVLFAVLIGLIGGWLFLVPLGAFCIVLGFAFVMKRAQWVLFERRKSLDARRYAFLLETLSNVQTVKANRMEPQMARRFEMLEEQTVNISKKLIQFAGIAQSFGAIFSHMMVAAMGLWGACLVIQNHIGIAELAACMLLNGRIIQPLTKLMTLWVQSENVSVARGRLNDMEELEVNEIPSGQVPEILGEISVREMTIERTDSAGALMAPVSFLVPPSGCVLLEAEQSWMVDSVFDAISGQRLPSNGEVLIDGFSGAKRVNQTGRGATIVLEADPAMFSGTLLENLSAFGDAQVVERAKKFAAALGLEKRIHRLPAGYNTVMTARTSFEKDPVNRHLVSLTRALALQPKILLMNEPSAALDTPERQALADCLRTLAPRPTIVLSSPDPRLRQLADQVVHLKAKLSDEITSWRDDAELDRQDALLKQRGAA
ncbi:MULTISPECIES: ABC transporter transmembrane domain-containing protein [unclassified Ruegeria]|uniref:ABC transporter transmembrane domain-containing protein n=1 Tax=unclassified Ruegeria TaxID=2625375 RepID=UPI001AD96FF5|nr:MULTISPECIES: ABC transporter transmembrane domain-containing protein [unclassified Ruegeria]MBO9412980.1 hypothetical protein [Ruegeria sp. R8_1]MBO9416473.1 hypothetical protein [Ruegeria sp. R8_2]